MTGIFHINKCILFYVTIQPDGG